LDVVVEADEHRCRLHEVPVGEAEHEVVQGGVVAEHDDRGEVRQDQRPEEEALAQQRSGAGGGPPAWCGRRARARTASVGEHGHPVWSPWWWVLAGGCPHHHTSGPGWPDGDLAVAGRGRPGDRVGVPAGGPGYHVRYRRRPGQHQPAYGRTAPQLPTRARGGTASLRRAGPRRPGTGAGRVVPPHEPRARGASEVVPRVAVGRVVLVEEAAANPAPRRTTMATSRYPRHRDASPATPPSDEGVVSSPRLPELEDNVLAYWKADGTFQASIDARPAGENGSNEFVFYDGPPFANGLPHYGHLLTGYVKDVVPRFQTMLGRRV